MPTRASGIVLAVALHLALPAQAADEGAVARGAYLFAAGDCAACHTDTPEGSVPLAGGRALKTEFGTFYGPNITPDPEHGIGRWSLADFRHALRYGEGKAGEYLYPVFPYAAFTGMSDEDIADLYAYLKTVTPSTQPNKPHELAFPYGFRPLLLGWRMIYLRLGPLAPLAGESGEWNRGRYLVEALGHCQECHTPRDILGGLDPTRAFAGNPEGPDGLKAPNITPDRETGIGEWSLDEIAEVLKSGLTPTFDSVGSGMGEVVTATAKLTDADRHAIAVYVKSLPAMRATGK